MKREDVKEGVTLLSPAGREWKVVKRYGPDMWLIKSKLGAVCILRAGQIRNRSPQKSWSLKRKG